MGDLRTRPALALGAAMMLLLGGGSTDAANLVTSGPAPGHADQLRGGGPGSRVLSTRAAARTAATRTTARWAGSVNVNSRTAVNAAY